MCVFACVCVCCVLCVCGVCVVGVVCVCVCAQYSLYVLAKETYIYRDLFFFLKKIGDLFFSTYSVYGVAVFTVLCVCLRACGVCVVCVWCVCGVCVVCVWCVCVCAQYSLYVLAKETYMYRDLFFLHIYTQKIPIYTQKRSVSICLVFYVHCVCLCFSLLHIPDFNTQKHEHTQHTYDICVVYAKETYTRNRDPKMQKRRIFAEETCRQRPLLLSGKYVGLFCIHVRHEFAALLHKSPENFANLL